MEYKTRIIAPNENYAREFVKKNLDFIKIKDVKELKRYQDMGVYEVSWMDSTR